MYYSKNNQQVKRLFKILASPLAGFFFLVLTACEHKNAAVKPYYAVDSLLQEQRAFLLASKATVEKTATLEGDQSRETFTPDSIGWVREFEVFSGMAELNKPVYRDRYRETVSKNNNNFQRIFAAADSDPEKNADLRVQKLVITYDNEMALQRIESTIREESPMFRGSRELLMEFETINGKTLLSQYRIVGGQKMFLADSVDYVIVSKIAYPQ